MSKPEVAVLGDDKCLVLARTKTKVRYLTLHEGGATTQLRLVEVPAAEFKHKLATASWPVVEVAKLLKQFALHLGATEEAAKALGTIINITNKEHETMTTAKTAKKPAAKKAPVKKAAAKKPAAKATKVTKATTTTSEGRQPSAASRFKELIMAGKQTDDEIFATVQKEFGLDDDKRRYVAWYRNQLDKQGQKPPAAK